jgi:hypothetical protein
VGFIGQRQSRNGRATAMLVPVTEDDIEEALLAYSPTL